MPACWYVGIVALDSDYAFTVTNVLIHGIPYFALVYFTRRTAGTAPPSSDVVSKVGRVIGFLGVLWMIAYAEELLWDRAIAAAKIPRAVEVIL